MNAYDCERIDKAMSQRVRAIYSDPARHKFQSEFHALANGYGIRGGVSRTRKSICFHCGQDRPGHAGLTEAL